ncbi:uncharacterized protein RCC_08815 [Ramularia collo-cygni]|uniref:Uncharacterized protein n=1 Tax=Ramularia collo-cygni TaxID=112498 RepID=A0A2D3VBQ2_9PEZI|nr:uncharacterized protein RCC_08815 [Ramularia collo-cygni]CZT23105.1 uncharacterized protein RCC_08815 [Ramularia collo-cygni]
MEWNNKPHDDFSSNSSREKTRQYAKDEFIQDIGHATKNADIVARRSERKHQRLNDDVAEEVVEKGPVLSVGELKYKGAWYSIIEDAVAKWLAGNEIRNVSKSSLAGLLQHRAWISDAEREKTQAQPEVPGAHALLPTRN